MKWKEAFQNKKFKYVFLVTIILLALTLTALANFLNFIETRNGVVFNDPVLKLFNPIDLTWFIFGLIYISLIASIIYFLKDPGLLLKALQAYIVLMIFRIMAMYLVPLDPPLKMIPLSDPFVELFGTGETLTKDLFFSGHTATLFLLFLLIENKTLKIIFPFFTLFTGSSVLLQHVHYSIDVFAAPFIAYCSFKLVEKSAGKFQSAVF
jgi:hypothetical protein